ncbi:HEAT repeat domain-containing protein [Kitasatospora sp. NPDC057198]|uniref:HEAT repeat domain-containing protein n=1 Tax=Kitasatospora sp. NPDC057198 TaxID=3346046 RepID=UPI003638DB11
MRTPEELDLVDWAAWATAEAPEWIRALYAEDAAVVDDALRQLFHHALHQGSVYPTAVAAVPYLAHAAVHGVHRRGDVLAFLAGTGGAEEVVHQSEQAVRGAALVAEELPFLLPLLGDADAEVRRQAVRVARWAAGQSLPLAVAALEDRLREDPSPVVRAEALTVLSHLEADPVGRLRAALDDPAPAVRATAALGLLSGAELPYPEEWLDVLVADGGDPAFRVVQGEWFPGVGSTEDRLQRLLNADPEATRAVAAAWVAAGDHDGRGSGCALRLARYWMGREAEAVALLAAALPLQREGRGRWRVLDCLADCLDPGTGAVVATAAAAASAALPHVDDPEQWVAEAAQLVLGRAGDRRLLTAVPAPAPAALDALAARTDDLDLRRQVLRDGLGRELLDSLTPADAAPLLPELTARLRRFPRAQLIHRLAEIGIADPELVALMAYLTWSTERVLSRAAAVAAARFGADPQLALRLLTEQLERGEQGCLTETALLGPVGAPLLPLVEPYLAAEHHPQTRVDAAEALWRITGDPARALPVLHDLLALDPPGLRALSLLRRIGRPVPEAQRSLLEWWSTLEPGELAEEDPWWSRRDHARLRADAGLLLARQS